MRICFVAHAGSANTVSWCNHFADVLGHDVHVVSLSDGAGLSDAVKLHVLGAPAAGPLSYVLAVPRVRRAVLSVDPDMVVGYRAISYGFMAAATGFRPLAVATQGQVVSPPAAALKRVLAGFALARADVVNSWGPHMTERLIEVGADPDRILTCPRGIDLGLFRPPDASAPRSPSVIVSRTFHRVYRHDAIVRAIKLVAGERDDVGGVFAGDGETRRDVEELSHDLGMNGRIEFLGNVDPATLADRLRDASVYVSAVPSDGVSASLLEAMASGTYPIVMDNEANRLWIQDGENGTLISSRKPEDLASAISTALSDDGLRARAAEMNRRIVEQRADLARNMRTIERAYERLVASRAGGRS